MGVDLEINQWVDIDNPFSPNCAIVKAKIITRSEITDELLGVVTVDGSAMMIDQDSIRHVYSMEESLLLDIRHPL